MWADRFRPVHTSLTRSFAPEHSLVGPQSLFALAQTIPQSTSLSPPFCTPSPQLGATQRPEPLQSALWQSAETMQP